MHIPSYDELTPSIPDVSHSDVFAAAERVLPASGVVASRSQAAVADGASALFACLRARRSPEAAMVIARDFSPRVERHGQGCVVLDISGLGRLLGDADAIGRELDREATIRGGITVAIAPTQAAALLLSLARPGLSVARSDPAGAVAGVPLAVLQQLVELEGAVTPATAHTFDVLQRWGLKTVGEFAALPAMSLSQRVGQGGIALQRLACGLDARPLVPDPGVPRFVQRMDLEWPIEGLEPLSFVLARLLDPLSSTLERADRGAAAVRLDLRLVDRSTHVRLLQLPAATRAFSGRCCCSISSRIPRRQRSTWSRSRSTRRRRASSSIRCSSARCRRQKHWQR
jgi:hypothetical protein